MANIVKLFVGLVTVATAYTPQALDDQIISLPDAPTVSFNQFSGYLTVNQTSGRNMFYWSGFTSISAVERAQTVIFYG